MTMTREEKQQNYYGELSKMAMCIGVGNIRDGYDYSNRIAYLLHLDDPHSVISRCWKSGEEFSIGKWYKRQDKHPKQYIRINDIVPTLVITQNGHEGAEKTVIEFQLVLPVFFAPNFTRIQNELAGNGGMLQFKDPISANIPLCPLFGPEWAELLPTVRWVDDDSSLISTQLYALKINLSYKFDVPDWRPQSVGEIKPWNYSEYPVMNQLYAESREKGLVVEQLAIVSSSNNNGNKQLQFCALLNKQAELAIGVYPQEQFAKIGDFREFWPIKLESTYCFPVSIALDCPQSNESVVVDENELKILLWKEGSFKSNMFQMVLSYKQSPFDNKIGDSYMLPWLGKLMDPVECLEEKNDLSAGNKGSVLLTVNLQYSLPKRKVAWVIVGKEHSSNNKALSPPNKQPDKNTQKPITSSPITSISNNNAFVRSGSSVVTTSRSISNSPSERGRQSVVSNRDESSDYAEFKSTSSNSNHQGMIPKRKKEEATSVVRSSPSTIPMPLGVGDKKTAIASFLTDKTQYGNPAFLFWDVNLSKFVRKCFAQSNMTSNFKRYDYGEWFELRYTDFEDRPMLIKIIDYAVTTRRVQGRIRGGICAQYPASSARDVRVWHKIWPSPECGNNYYVDRGWSPMLCKKCFPGLPDRESLEPSKMDVSSSSTDMDELADQMGNTLHFNTSPIKTDGNRENFRSPQSVQHPNSRCSSASAGLQKSPTATIPSASPTNPMTTTTNTSKPSSTSSSSTTTALAVLLAVRNYDSVFLLFDAKANEFTFRVYGEHPDNITGNPKVGSWYRMEYKLRSAALANAQKINVLSVCDEGVECPVPTRVNNGLAQFNLPHKPPLVTWWHNIEEKHQLPKLQGPWWPQWCPKCLEAADEAEFSPPKNMEKKERLIGKNEKPDDDEKKKKSSSNNARWTTTTMHRDDYSDSDASDSDASGDSDSSIDNDEKAMKLVLDKELITTTNAVDLQQSSSSHVAASKSGLSDLIYKPLPTVDTPDTPTPVEATLSSIPVSNINITHRSMPVLVAEEYQARAIMMMSQPSSKSTEEKEEVHEQQQQSEQEDIDNKGSSSNSSTEKTQQETADRVNEGTSSQSQQTRNELNGGFGAARIRRQNQYTSSRAAARKENEANNGCTI